MASAGPVSMALTEPGKDLGLLEYTVRAGPEKSIRSRSKNRKCS